MGEFLDCTEDREPSFRLSDILHQYFDKLDCPVIYNFPYGHSLKLISMPIGAMAHLDTEKELLSFENLFIS